MNTTFILNPKTILFCTVILVIRNSVSSLQFVNFIQKMKSSKSRGLIYIEIKNDLIRLVSHNTIIKQIYNSIELALNPSFKYNYSELYFTESDEENPQYQCEYIVNKDDQDDDQFNCQNETNNVWGQYVYI